MQKEKGKELNYDKNKKKQMMSDQVVTLLTCIQEVPGLSLNLMLFILTYEGISKSFQTELIMKYALTFGVTH
jgi:hypothetical protein